MKVGLAFGMSKSTVFFVPLLLSNLLTTSDYGLFESCLAYGSLIAIIVGCGLVAAVPYFMMVRNTTSFNGLIYLHAAVLFFLLLMLFPFFLYESISASFFLVFIFAAVINWQRIFAADMKTRSKPTLSSFSESFLYLVIIFAALLTIKAVSIHQIAINLAIFFFPLSIILSILMLRKHPVTSITYGSFKELYAFALPTILPGMLLLLITTLVRLVAPVTIGTEKLAIYSFYFRFASVSVVVYQFLATVYFSEMYKRESADLDSIFTKVSLLILFVGVVGFVSFPHVLSGVFKLFSTFKDYWILYAVLVFFCFFWVCEAMLESIIYRSKLSHEFLWLQLGSLGFFSVLTATVFVLNKDWLTITLLALMHTLLMAMVVYFQMRLLAKNGISLPWLMRLNLVSIFMLIFSYSLSSVMS